MLTNGTASRLNRITSLGDFFGLNSPDMCAHFIQLVGFVPFDAKVLISVFIESLSGNV